MYWINTPVGPVPATDGHLRQQSIGAPDEEQPGQGSWYECAVIGTVFRSHNSSLTLGSQRTVPQKHAVRYGADGPVRGEVHHNLMHRLMEDGRPDTHHITFTTSWQFADATASRNDADML